MNTQNASECEFVEVDLSEEDATQLQAPQPVLQHVCAKSECYIKEDGGDDGSAEDDESAESAEDDGSDKDEENVCAICLEDMNTCDTPLFEMYCEHMLHYDCATHYLTKAIQDKKDITCPICRAILLTSSEYVPKMDTVVNINEHHAMSSTPISTSVIRPIEHSRYFVREASSSPISQAQFIRSRNFSLVVMIFLATILLTIAIISWTF
jgi:hypothetical protein